jgi:basic membrane protein A
MKISRGVKSIFAAAAALVPLAVLSACTPGSDPANNDDGKTQVAIVFDSGGRGDKSFNDSAWRGIQRATTELGVASTPYDSDSERDYESNLVSAADSGADIVIAVGINMVTALTKVAGDYPDTNFAIVDGDVDLPNVRALKFSEEQGSFLVGYLAGSMTETGKLGFIGGQQIDLIKKFQAGFIAGAKTARSDVTVGVKYTESWDNVDVAKVAAGTLYDGGADIIYHAAGRAGLGLIREAKERGLFAIGVDSDQDDIEEGSVLTSMIKKVDEAVFLTVQDVQAGEFNAGSISYDLASNGVGISELRFTRDLIGEDRLADLEEIKELIVSGELVVPTTLDELDLFVSAL